jgi:hypothetical protein
LHLYLIGPPLPLFYSSPCNDEGVAGSLSGNKNQLDRYERVDPTLLQIQRIAEK